MAQDFPAIKPSNREFTLGLFPTKTYRALSGVSVKRSFGNKPHSYQLRLVFANIPDITLNELLAHYENTEGGFNRFAVPARVFAGKSDSAINKIRNPYGIQWEYASPPSVQSVFNGISTVTIDLAGELSV